MAASGERGFETMGEEWGVSRGGVDGLDEVDEDEEDDIEVGQVRDVYTLRRQARRGMTRRDEWVKAGPCRGQRVQGVCWCCRWCYEELNTKGDESQIRRSELCSPSPMRSERAWGGDNEDGEGEHHSVDHHCHDSETGEARNELAPVRMGEVVHTANSHKPYSRVHVSEDGDEGSYRPRNGSIRQGRFHCSEA
jgi:hypothetical protein